MDSNKKLSVGRLVVSAVVLAFMVSAAIPKDISRIAQFDSASTLQLLQSRLIDQFDPASTVQKIERHLQDSRTNLSSKQIPSVARLLYEESNCYGIDYRLVLAIMAVESNFRNDAVSEDGARGIMQIKPILASFIAKIAGIPYRGVPDLFEPANNVRIGLYYLSWLSSIFKNTNEVLLAYNMGHNRAKEVLSHAGDADSRYTRRVMVEYRRNMTKLPAM
jgi:soluble lytic murein transglycosylase